jgi:hypothetical protein
MLVGKKYTMKEHEASYETSRQSICAFLRVRAEKVNGAHAPSYNSRKVSSCSILQSRMTCIPVLNPSTQPGSH